MSPSLRSALAVVVSFPLFAAPPPPPVPAAVRPALAAILPQNLKGDLSFLSSDALAGRYTPSPGLDAAAEFIASQFRAAGLRPAGDRDYFQMAAMVDRRMPPATHDLTVNDGTKTIAVAAASLAIFSSPQALSIERCPVVLFASKDPELLKHVDLKDKAVFAPERSLKPVPPEQLMQSFQRSREFDMAVNAAGAKIEILVGRAPRANRPRLLSAQEVADQKTPIVVADNDALKALLTDAREPDGERTVSIDLPGPEDHPATLKNVIGILPGSDPKLKDTYVLLTAHYDHIGTLDTAGQMAPRVPAKENSDRIYNGANDDGSGTVSVIEIARGLASLPVRPKRTMVFMTFFGEERGDIGSGYYGNHPVFPIGRTVADLNLEQVGRTDSTEGKQVNNASVTGFDYSDVTTYLQKAGRQTGITVYLNKGASDQYFERSDNAALALQGVPAHTLCVAFDYPDYHGLGDEWPKVDFENMAKVDRAVALALWNIANTAAEPQWNAANPKTAAFRQARARSLQDGNKP